MTETKTETDVNCSINIILPKDNKPYYEYQLKQFCSHFDSSKLMAIEFGKQDIGGSISITFVDKKHCVPSQKHFYNKFELLGFICGFNKSQDKKIYPQWNEVLRQ